MQSTATIAETSQAGSPWALQLVALRRRIRLLIVAKAFVLLLMALAMGFWSSLAIDWIGELPLAFRGLILILFFPLTIGVMWRYSLCRLQIPLTDSSMALLLERRYPMLEERLLTVVELSGADRTDEECDPRLVAQLAEEIGPLFPLTGTARIFNLGPLFRSSLLAFVGMFSVLLFWALQPTAMHVWAQRNLALQSVSWPRATSISVLGFPASTTGQRVEKVARGGQATVRVRADLDYEIPQRVELHFVADDGSVRRVPMTRLKAAVPGRDQHQEYEYVFTNLRASTPLTIIGESRELFAKSDRVEGLRIEAVESPNLIDIQLSYTYPGYLKKRPDKGSVRVNPPIPRGTQVSAVCRSNKPLVAARYRKGATGEESGEVEIDLDPQDAHRFQVDMGTIHDDTHVHFQLTDADQIENSEPIRIGFRTIEDRVPQVEIQLDGIGKSITPLAVIPLRGSVQDDYGVAESWIAYSVDGAPESAIPLSLSPEGELDGSSSARLDIEPLRLQPSQRITLGVCASDHCDLRETESHGESPKYTLKIVTESQLRAELEAREKILRRRTETILADGERMQDSLKRMRRSADRSESSGEESASSRQDSIRIVRVESAVKAAERMRHETANVAMEFDRILIELRNNRVTLLGELEERIGERIVAPLDRIASVKIPELEQKLQIVRDQLADAESFVGSLSVAENHLREILRQMELVIENMLKLQRFNEVLADLRKIIEAQQQVSSQTSEQRQRLEAALKEQLKKDLLD